MYCKIIQIESNKNNKATSKGKKWIVTSSSASRLYRECIESNQPKIYNFTENKQTFRNSKNNIFNNKIMVLVRLLLRHV